MVFGFSGDAAGGFPHAVGTGGNLALPGGAPFLWRNGGKSTRGLKIKVLRIGSDRTVPRTVRPLDPAGERVSFPHTPTVTLCLFPKGTYLRPQPAQPVGGPLRAFRWEGRRPGTKTEVQPPPPQPHQRRGSPGRNLLPRGFFPPFLPKKWGPGWASQGSLPFQRRRRKTTMAPHPGGPRPRPFQRRRKKPRRETTFFFPTSLICVILWG